MKERTPFFVRIFYLVRHPFNTCGPSLFYYPPKVHYHPPQSFASLPSPKNIHRPPSRQLGPPLSRVPLSSAMAPFRLAPPLSPLPSLIPFPPLHFFFLYSSLGLCKISRLSVWWYCFSMLVECCGEFFFSGGFVIGFSRCFG